ncbi:MAG: dihydroorotase [Muribaculum sp.]|nr:dihydroorotase [Muribaculum sp.]
MLLIRNGYLIDPKSGREGNYDVLTDGDKIIRIGRVGQDMKKPVRCEVIDAKGLVVAPGLVDVHVHFREPGFTHKEDIATGAAAAAKGGYTTVVMMANTKPPIDNEETLQSVLKRADETDIHVTTCANVTVGMKGVTLTDMEKLAACGAAGFTDDGIPILDEGIVRQAMERAARLDLPVSFHEEDSRLIAQNGVNRGQASAHLGIEGSPREAEIVLIDRDLKLALETGACVNIQHISTAEGVELVRRAKAKSTGGNGSNVRGRNLHAEATPHHFTLTEEAVIRCGTLAKVNPPLRTEEDRQAIIRGLADGTIDIIATDHAPHSEEEKAKPLTEAPSGMIGLETALSLGITELVQKGYLTMRQLLCAMSANPAAMYHLDAGYLAEGGPADLVLIDPTETFVAGDFASKAKNSPFTGRELMGMVKATICAGRVVYRQKGVF